MHAGRFYQVNYWEIDWSTIPPKTPVLYVLNGRAYICTYLYESRNHGRVVIDMEVNGTMYQQVEVRSCDIVLIENIGHYMLSSLALSEDIIRGN